MFKCLRKKSEKPFSSYVIKFMLDHFSDEKFHEDFQNFLKKFPGNYILPLEKNALRKYILVGVNPESRDKIDQLMFDFNFQFRSTFIQYLTYFLYEKYFGSYEEILHSPGPLKPF